MHITSFKRVKLCILVISTILFCGFFSFYVRYIHLRSLLQSDNDASTLRDKLRPVHTADWTRPYTHSIPIYNLTIQIPGIQPPLNSTPHHYLPKFSAWEYTKDPTNIPVSSTLHFTSQDLITNIRVSGKEYKYFKEYTPRRNIISQIWGQSDPPISRTDHYDWRFHNSINSGDRVDQLKELFAAWAGFADTHHIPYWISHGTLLGWYWGGRIMPFDDDIDLQTTANSLFVLSKYNQTIVSNRFLIDVNPHHMTRTHQKHNIIDARFIDTTNSRFIDITGISVLSSSEMSLTLGDKTVHKYSMEDLFPLTRTMMEGIPTWRPNKVLEMLGREYKNGMKRRVYKAHIFNHHLSKWVPITTCEMLFAYYVTTESNYVPPEFTGSKFFIRWIPEVGDKGGCRVVAEFMEGGFQRVVWEGVWIGRVVEGVKVRGNVNVLNKGGGRIKIG